MASDLHLFTSGSSDMAKLNSTDEYTCYFKAVLGAMQKMMLWFESVGARRDAAEKLKPFVVRLLKTLAALQSRHIFDPLHSLSLDLNHSGFPTAIVFKTVELDQASPASLETTLPSASFLKDKLIEELIRNLDASRTLELLGIRSYVDILKAEELFLSFTPGEFSLIDGQNSGMRRYEFTFGVFCQGWNLPFLYHLIFEQDEDEESIETNEFLRNQFLETLKYETRYESQIGVIAMNLDAAMPTIHPKIFQRIRIGPFWSLVAKHEKEQNSFYELLQSEIAQPQDFVLEMLIEMVSSYKTTEVSSGFLGLSRQLRESFFIPSDAESQIRKASQVTKWLMMPHRLHQLANWSSEGLSSHRHSRKILLTQNGNIHEAL